MVRTHGALSLSPPNSLRMNSAETALVAGCSVRDTIGVPPRARIMPPNISPVLPAYVTHVRALERYLAEDTRKRIYAPNRLPLCDPRADRGANLFGSRGVDPGRGATGHYSTFRSEMPPRSAQKKDREKRGGRRESSTKRTEFTVPGQRWRGKRGDKSQGCCGNVLTGEDHL